MSNSSAQVKLLIDAIQAPASPGSGGNRHQVNVDTRLADGLASNQFDLLHQSVRQLAAGANEDIDFRLLLDAQGIVMSTLTDMVLLVIETDPGNNDDIDVGPSAADGWFSADSIFTLVGDNLQLKPGGTYVLVYNPVDGAYLVSGTEKSITVLNIDGGQVADYTLTILARSA